MRIAYIQNANLPTEWAHGYQIMKTCEAMTRAGFALDLIVADRHNPLNDRDVFVYYDMKPSFALHRIPVIDWVNRVPPALQALPYLLERWTFLRGVQRFLATNTFDLIYTRDVRIAEDVLARMRLPVMLELHDDPRTNRMRWQRVKSKAAGYVVITESLRKLLLGEGIPSAAICVAPDGFDEQKFSELLSKSQARQRLQISENVRLVVYVGQLLPWKGVDALTPVFDQIPEGCQVVCIGGQKEDLERLQTLAPHASRVHFVGQAPRTEVLVWLAAADAGLLSTSAVQAIGREYTSPLKLFEYLAAGLPVIASDVPSSHEILDSRIALFFQPDDARSFLETLNLFMRLSDEEVLRMSDAAHQASRGYSWTMRGERIAACVHQRVS